MVKAATVMAVYALALLGVGWITYDVSPPGSKAFTALLVPGILGVGSIVCAVLTMMSARSRRIALVGVWVGLAIPVLGALGSFMRLGGSLDAAHAFNATLKETGAVIVAEDAKKQPVHNKAYQAVGLAAIGAMSVFGFVVLALHLPRIPKPAPEPTEFSDPPKERLSPSQD